MKIKPNLLSGIALIALTLTGCAAQQQALPIQMPQPPAIVAEAERAEPQVRSTLVEGEGTIPRPGAGAPPRPVRGGNVNSSSSWPCSCSLSRPVSCSYK